LDPKIALTNYDIPVSDILTEVFKTKFTDNLIAAKYKAVPAIPVKPITAYNPFLTNESVID